MIWHNYFIYQSILDINIYHKCLIQYNTFYNIIQINTFNTNINYNIEYDILKINIMKDKSSSIVYIIINLKIVIKNIKIRNIQELLLNNYINLLISILFIQI